MSRKIPPLERLVLKGLEMAPSQVWGSVRLVPLLRHTILGDLRLSRRSYDEDATWVDLADKTVYCSYIPHALIASWTPDSLPIAAFARKNFLSELLILCGTLWYSVFAVKKKKRLYQTDRW